MKADRARAVLSIGTVHPWNHAGLGLDLLVGAERRVRVLTVVAGVSAQDAAGLHALEAVSPSMLQAQLEAVPADEIGAIRVGALPSIESILGVARALEAFAVPAVVDPVFAATLGGSFADTGMVEAFAGTLARLPSVVLTPNLGEAASLLERGPIGRDELRASALALLERGPRAVLLTGGHLEGDPADTLAHDGDVQTFSEPRLPGDMRGTGCVLAMALAGELAGGAALVDGVIAARSFVRTKIASARRFGGLNVPY